MKGHKYLVDEERRSIDYWSSDRPSITFSVITLIGVIIYLSSYGSFVIVASSLNPSYSYINSTSTYNSNFAWGYVPGISAVTITTSSLTLLGTKYMFGSRFFYYVTLLGIADVALFAACVFGNFLSRINNLYLMENGSCFNNLNDDCIKLEQSFTICYIGIIIVFASSVFRLFSLALYRHYTFPDEQDESSLELALEKARRKDEFNSLE